MLLTFWITVFYIKIILNVIYSCNGKAEFSASLLQSSESYDPSEIIMLLNIFLKSVFSGFFDEQKVKKNSYCILSTVLLSRKNRTDLKIWNVSVYNIYIIDLFYAYIR